MASLDPRASALVADDGTARSGDAAGSDGGDGRPAVLFVSYTADWRGPTLSLLHLLDHLEERYRVGVALAGSGGFLEALEERGVPHFRFDRLDKWAIPRLARIVRDHDYDLVYANSTHGSARNAFLAAKLARARFVCHVRSMGWDKGWTRLGYLWLADAVIAVSDACAASVARFVRTGRLQRVYNGVPLATGDRRVDGAPRGPEARRSAALRDAVGAGSNEPLFLSVSHVCRRKNQVDAVRAMPEVLGELPGAHLCLVGSTEREPDYTARIGELARRLGVGDRVHLLGFRSDVAELMQGADVFVHTATSDPHPRSVIEAMGAGLPVVAFAADGVEETVLDGRTGRLVDPGDAASLADAMVGVLAGDGIAARMGSAGRRRVEEQFTATATASRVDGILRDVLKQRESTRARR